MGVDACTCEGEHPAASDSNALTRRCSHPPVMFTPGSDDSAISPSGTPLELSDAIARMLYFCSGWWRWQWW